MYESLEEISEQEASSWRSKSLVTEAELERRFKATLKVTVHDWHPIKKSVCNCTAACKLIMGLLHVYYVLT